MNKKISVTTWADISAKVPKNSPNREIYSALDQVSKSLSDPGGNYVYIVRFEFGDKIITNGRFEKDDMEMENNAWNKTLFDFKTDVNYSDDPLGIVLNNYVEVYTENKSITDKNQIYQYTIPLKIIGKGDLFGLFGTLDYLDRDKEKQDQ